MARPNSARGSLKRGARRSTQKQTSLNPSGGSGEQSRALSCLISGYRLQEQRVRPLPKNTHCPKNTQCKLKLTVLRTPSAGRSSRSLQSPSPSAARGAVGGSGSLARAPRGSQGFGWLPRGSQGTMTLPSAEKRPRLRDPPKTFTHLQRSVRTCSSNLRG